MHEVLQNTLPGRFHGRHNGSQPVTTGHKVPKEPQPQRAPPWLHPSQRVTHAHSASAPASPTRHDGSRILTGPQPQRISPVTTGHNVPTGSQPKRAPPFTARHNCPQGLSPSVPQRPPPDTKGHKCSRRQPQAHSIRRPLWGLKACEMFFFEEDPLCSLPHKASELFPETANMAYC